MRYYLLSLGLIASGLILNTPVVFADKVCVKKKLRAKQSGRVPHKKALRVVTGDCPGSFVELLDTSTFTGPQGPAGEDASSLLYGNGSAGDLTVSVSDALGETNLNFENITIDSGVTLSLRSGAIIRCTGTFTNNGTLRVYAYGSGGSSIGETGQSYSPPMAAFMTGRVAGAGECGAAGTNRSGANSLSGVTPSALAQYIKLGPLGGGGGGGTVGGGKGGGTVTILCEGSIVNAGTITANGDNGFVGSGGGGGGLVILASGTSVVNSGTIEVLGGDGGASSSATGAGGGGGGGLTHFISSSITAGTVDTSGGSAGDNTIDATSDPACAGGAGGSGVAISGAGGDISVGDTSGSANSGFSGGTIETEEDPVDVFGVY